MLRGKKGAKTEAAEGREIFNLFCHYFQ